LDCIAKSGSVYNFFSFQFQIANDTVLKSPSFVLKDGTLCDEFGQLPEFSILDFWPKYCRVFAKQFAEFLEATLSCAFRSTAARREQRRRVRVIGTR
jgi:hypothetical protein